MPRNVRHPDKSVSKHPPSYSSALWGGGGGGGLKSKRAKEQGSFWDPE